MPKAEPLFRFPALAGFLDTCEPLVYNVDVVLDGEVAVP
jgi:hypothetical protein